MKKNKHLIFILIILIIGMIIIWKGYKAYNQSIPENVYYSNGRLEMVRVDVATIYPGRILSIDVEEGQHVSKEQILAKMEQTEPMAQIKIAEAAKQRAVAAKQRANAELEAHLAKFNVAKIDYNNAKQLKKENLISKSELEKRTQQYNAEEQAINAVKAAIEEANAAIKQADANIAHIQTINNDMELKAPIDGYIEYKLLEPGSVIPAGGRILSLLDNSKVHMNIFLPTVSISKINIGDDARIILDGIDQVIPAKVTFISSQSQFTPKFVETQNEREKLMYKVKLSISTEDAKKYTKLLKAGLTGNGYIKTGSDNNWPSQFSINDK